MLAEGECAGVGEILDGEARVGEVLDMCIGDVTGFCRGDCMLERRGDPCNHHDASVNALIRSSTFKPHCLTSK